MAGTKFAALLKQNLRFVLGVRYQHGSIAPAIVNTKKVENVTKNVHSVADALQFTLADSTQKTTVVRGWVQALRVQKTSVFLDINDGSSRKRLQIYLSPDKKPKNLTWGSAVVAEGKLSTTPKGQVELIADKLEVVGECVVTEGYPFNSKQNHPPEYLRQYLHLRPRTDYISSILRVRASATRAIHEYFNSLHYININAPILTSNDCEGAGETFKVKHDSDQTFKKDTKSSPLEQKYFNVETFLSVSGQLHLEAAAHGLSRVYTFGPTFRAENSKSRLHLSEFYMLEAETAFVDDLNEVIYLIENLLKYVVKYVLSNCEDDVYYLRGKDCHIDWLDKPFIKMTYDEAIDVLQKNDNKFKIPLLYDSGLVKEHELKLVELMDGVPTFVTDWPQILKPFYMKSLPDDETKVAALDLLAPITGEVAGGSLRENNYELLQKKLPTPALNWYLELRKFGNVPTGGFGLGFERCLQSVCNILNIKDTIPFPRWPHNCSM